MLTLILLHAVLALPTQVAQISSTNSVAPSDADIVEIDTALEEYQAQAASRDPLDAMSVLDALGNVVLWKLEGYDIAWNPQEQTLEVFLDGLMVSDVATGIDGLGRQVFAIPLPDPGAFLTGWVDVDMVHSRIILCSTSLPINMIIPFVQNDGGTVSLLAPKGKGCACVDKKGMFQWCNYSSNCDSLTVCTFYKRTGTCKWRKTKTGPPVIQQSGG